MKNWIYSIILTLAAAMTFAACSDNDGPASAQECERAVLVYMVANNSLGTARYDEADIAEMLDAAAHGDLGNSRLFVYHHSRNADPVLKEITPRGEMLVKAYNTDNSSVSAARMNEVIADFKRTAPATARGLILWSHGSGWIENGLQEPTVNAQSQPGNDAVQPLSFGDDGGRYMNVTTMARVLEGNGFDYIYFDCCYMAGVEVAYELRHCADRIVASATELPANGMPYDRTLRHLMKADADLTAAARATFDHYDNLAGSARTCTISVIDTDALDNLAAATRAVYSANNVTSEGFAPQHFMTSACYLFDFGQYVDNLAADYPTLKADFDAALDDAVIYSASTPNIWNILILRHHSGLSTYLPEFSATNRYNYDNLQWAKDVASTLSPKQ
ncbi:MAG: hypothetical protein HDS61_01445 [Barnesiella sp.]|nr:hypothetical protein [Barnesiella sp.]